MNINSYESEYYKQANHNLLALWKIIAMVLFIAYIGEFLKGNIQMACLILSGMFLYKTMDLNIFANNKVKTEIENSLHDPLTQSYNRNFIFEYFNKITLKSLTDTGVSFILIDIDNFKKLNDTKGHDFGDKVLVTLCQAVNNILKQYDDAYLIRMGGDEFAIVSTNFTKENSLKLVNKIKTDFNNLFIEKMIDVTFSIGISNSLIDNCNSYIELYNLADKRLYNSKNNGKNMATYN